MKRKLQKICYANSAYSLWRKSSSRGYALILREMLYDMPLCPENQGRFMERRLDMESKVIHFLQRSRFPG